MIARFDCIYTRELLCKAVQLLGAERCALSQIALVVTTGWHTHIQILPTCVTHKWRDDIHHYLHAKVKCITVPCSQFMTIFHAQTATRWVVHIQFEIRIKAFIGLLKFQYYGSLDPVPSWSSNHCAIEAMGSSRFPCPHMPQGYTNADVHSKNDSR